MAENDSDEEKTEEATPRRRQEARERGQVALSTEVLAAVLLTAALVGLALLGGPFASACGEVVHGTCRRLGAIGTEALTIRDTVALVAGQAQVVGLATVAIVLPLWLLTLVAGYGQIGFMITPKAVGWDPGRLDPVRGMKRMFSLRSLVRSLLALVKVVAVIVAMMTAAWSQMPTVSQLPGQDFGPTLAGAGRIALVGAGAGVGVIVAIALIDWFYQRWQHERDMRMSKKELREEARTTEGDPHVRARVRAIQREMSRRRMMEEVPRATVVVTNPTHFAVALHYEREPSGARRSAAPRVVAKGADLMAARIREVAREAGVPLVEDPPLARALHAQVEIGEEVPESLYQAVAAVLAYVYRLRGARGAEPVPAGGER